MSADLNEIRDALAGWPIGSGYYQTKVGVDEAAEMAKGLAASGGPIAAILARAERAEAAVERVRAVLRTLDSEEDSAGEWFCGKGPRLAEVRVRALDRIERALDGAS